MIENFARRFFKDGGLIVELPNGRSLTLGQPKAPALTARFKDMRTASRVLRSPRVALGEAYMDGALIIEQGELWDFIDLLGRNLALQPRRWRGPVADVRRRFLNWRAQSNGRLAARRNVAHHYDLSLELYRRFLDEDLQYSCAYFARPDMSLEQAQAEKKRRIMAKLLLEPEQKVLDIGCGWGGMALSLAESGVHATGVTLSQEQLRIAQKRAQDRGLASSTRFELRDYRDLDGPYDRIVSVGMFEHVGLPNYDTYFQNVARLLNDDGVALIHSIGRSEGPGVTQPWIAKYIFPGGYIPALSEVMPAIERAGLLVTDVEILRLHYAETLRCWRERFEQRRAEIAELYDERFCRMWEFYLAISELSFRHLDHMVFQIQLAKRIDTVPINRDYLRSDADPANQIPDAIASAA